MLGHGQCYNFNDKLILIIESKLRNLQNYDIKIIELKIKGPKLYIENYREPKLQFNLFL